MISFLIRLAEKGFLPDFFIRIGIKRLSKVRLDFAKNSSPDEIEKRHDDWVQGMKKSPIALVPEKANEQHYEVPPEFFEIVLGSISNIVPVIGLKVSFLLMTPKLLC